MHGSTQKGHKKCLRQAAEPAGVVLAAARCERDARAGLDVSANVVRSYRTKRLAPRKVACVSHAGAENHGNDRALRFIRGLPPATLPASFWGWVIAPADRIGPPALIYQCAGKRPKLYLGKRRQAGKKYAPKNGQACREGFRRRAPRFRLESGVLHG